MFVSRWNSEEKNFRKQDVRETSYSAAVIDGEKLFQIQTYGAAGSSGTAKQVIQFYQQRAVELIDILKREFNL